MDVVPRSGEVVEVVVVGAGYAGLMATNRLLGSLTDAERSGVRVTVVNPRTEFVERIRLHELIGGSRSSAVQSLRDLLHPAAQLVEGAAQMIDAHTRTLHVTGPAGLSELHWDYLLYAVGSVSAAPVAGAREHAHLVGDLDSAAQAARAIERARPGGRVVVVGGGLTGIEVASEVAEQRPGLEVTLLCAGELAPGMRPAARRTIRRTLTRLGVAVVEQTTVSQIHDGKLELASGGVEDFDVCLVATSFDVPGLARVSGLAVDRSGRLRVDDELRSIDEPRIFGAGDAVVAGPAVGGHLRMSCAVALPTGAHAADNLLRAVRGERLEPLSAGFLVQCIALGRKSGYIQLVRADDTPRSVALSGRPAAFLKEKICTMVVDVPVRESERAGKYSWPRGPRAGATP